MRFSNSQNNGEDFVACNSQTSATESAPFVWRYKGRFVEWWSGGLLPLNNRCLAIRAGARMNLIFVGAVAHIEAPKWLFFGLIRAGAPTFRVNVCAYARIAI
jgi:hypothetical protein